MPATDELTRMAGSEPQHRKFRTKTQFWAVVSVLSNVAGNSALTHGMQALGGVGNTPMALIGALFHPWVAAGVALLIVWTFAHMALLSWADLSYVMPVTAIGYVVTAFAGKFFLGEVVSPMRWAGIVLITAGVTLVGRTAPASSAAASGKGACR
jgi:drug/metabolite transporter (DMT)-like permease